MQDRPTGTALHVRYSVCRSGSDLDLDLHTGGELKLHQGVHRLGVGLLDVKKPAVGVELELLTGLLVHEGGAVHGEDLLVGGKGNGAIHLSTGRLHGLDDLGRGLVHEHVVERLEFDSNFLAHIKSFFSFQYYSSSDGK